MRTQPLRVPFRHAGRDRSCAHLLHGGAADPRSLASQQAANIEKVIMTAGESIKDAGENSSKVTDRVVDAVEDKVNSVTDVVEDALRTAADQIHKAASQPEVVRPAK